MGAFSYVSDSTKRSISSTMRCMLADIDAEAEAEADCESPYMLRASVPEAES
jgi:hypothetical protein